MTPRRSELRASLFSGHDFAAASCAIARALSLNGSCAIALYFGAHIHSLSGDPTKGENYALRALRLSPFDPLCFVAHFALGNVRFRERRYEDAASSYAEGVRANPRFSTLYALQDAALGWLAASMRRSRSLGGCSNWSRPF